MTVFARSCTLAIGLIVVSPPSWAADPIAGSPVAESGRDSFQRYCTSCHGSEGRGDGPLAAALVTKPPDLTLISQRRGGTFPLEDLAKLIDGRELPKAHGTREMPIWGKQFTEAASDDAMAEQIARGEVLMILVYLRSIQR